MQYAIHTEHELKQPFSHRTFSRIRERFQAVYKATGRDLLQEVTDVLNTVVENEVLGNTDYSDQFAKVYRMDSMSIDMHGAHMTRLELAYVVNKMNVRAIESVKGKDEIPSELTHYLEDSDHNKVIYYNPTLPVLYQKKSPDSPCL